MTSNTSNIAPFPDTNVELEDLGPELKSQVSHGLDLLLAHFKTAGQKLFPRKISTYLHYGITVNSKEEILRECERASYVDCRINAYPLVVDEDIEAGLVAPTILFCDIDKSLFRENKQQLYIILNNTIAKIKDTFGQNIMPMVLWTGNGYHLYTVVETKPLNVHPKIVQLDLCPPNTEASKEFLRFSEMYFTDGKGDPVHASTLSLKSCLLRIPGTFNSKCLENMNNDSNLYLDVETEYKNRAQVQVIHEAMGIGIVEKPLIREFRWHLSELKLNYLIRQNRLKKYADRQSHLKVDYTKAIWIEELLQTPIPDFRKFCIWRVLTPYLLNVKKMSQEQAYCIINDWLERCNEVKKLDFDSDKRIQEEFSRIRPEIYQIGLRTLKEKNCDIYQFFEREGIIK